MISKSKGFNPNYLCTVCKIDNITPIEGADRIVKTVINGYDMIISNKMKVGDIVLYFPCECCINEKILSANNLFERGHFEMNSNADEVKELIVNAENASTEDEKIAIAEEIKGKCGFFNAYGRVRILKLRGQYSQGFIMHPVEMMKAFPNTPDWDWSEHVGEQFDMVGDEVVCWKYVVSINKVQEKGSQSLWKKRMRTLKRFDRIIEGTFRFHYDTTMLAEHMKELSPDDVVTITVKVHGTSGIFSNIPVKRELNFFEKVKKFFGFKVNETEHELIYSSRTVIKNRYVNKGVTSGFYDTDVWGTVAKELGGIIPKNWTIYGEIVGYVPGSNGFIQKGHDYGCTIGNYKFMPYRISTLQDNGEFFEWNVLEVKNWTETAMKMYPELADKLMPINILYHGSMENLYKLNTENHWHENVLAMLKTDKKEDKDGHRGFGMELDEPMCKNKVPREGIVIRIDNDKTPRAWKLKTARHYGKEAEQHDNGEIDIEENA